MSESKSGASVPEAREPSVPPAVEGERERTIRGLVVEAITAWQRWPRGSARGAADAAQADTRRITNALLALLRSAPGRPDCASMFAEQRPAEGANALNETFQRIHNDPALFAAYTVGRAEAAEQITDLRARLEAVEQERLAGTRKE